MKKILLLSVLALHFALVIYCFGFALARPEQSGLLPVLVYCTDLPASYFFMQLHMIAPDGYVSGLIFDGSLFVVFGSLWWLAIVWLLSRVWRFLVSRSRHGYK